MKHLYIGFGILLLCLALCCVSIFVLGHTVERTTNLLQQALELGDQEYFDQAQSLTEEAMALWNAHRGFFGVILRHDEADEVNAAFQELQEYVQNECIEEFEPSCARLIEQIRHIADMERPLYYNVLSVTLA
jgi:hypothetical protein